MDEIETKPTEGDRVEEYFQLKDSLRTFRNDLKDLKESQPDFEELKKLVEKTKTLRQRLTNNEDIAILQDKVDGIKERMDLIKEIIKTELIESQQEEVKHNGRKLRLVQVIKELRDQE